MTNPWSVEQVEAIAPSASAFTAAQPLATPMSWSGLGCDAHVVWGSCQGSGAEPYRVGVDHVGVAFTCSCPSRRVPCKHALALLLLWARGQVVEADAPPRVEAWRARRSARLEQRSERSAEGGSGVDPDPSGGVAPATPGPDVHDAPPSDAATDPPPDPDRARDERVARMHAGLADLDRWLDDRMRTGLADPSLARYSTWDSLAARLVDAQAGSMANRIRRLAGLVGAAPDWHDDVLAELGLLHLLSQAGRRLNALPDPLADAVATTVGWQVRRADVLAGVPDTDEWIVAGRSDQREDRIEVRRHWLRGRRSGRWALVLSFAAFQQSLDTSLEVGTAIEADLHRYPGPALRALVGTRLSDARPASPPAGTIAESCDEIGAHLVGEPWLDRLPSTAHVSMVAAPAGGWALGDDTGSLPILSSTSGDPGLATVLAVTEGRRHDITFEWTPHGVIPIAVHLADRSIDVGPRADPQFVSSS